MRDQWEEWESEKTCGIDIDGVLNYYPECWLDYIEGVTGIRYKTLGDAKEVIPYNEYRRLKAHYREGGYEASVPAREGSSELTSWLKGQGFRIFLLTKRPVDKHKLQWTQTREWLHKNKITFDGIFADENKHSKIITSFPNLKFMIEDHRAISNLVARWGYRVFLVDNIYNQGPLLSKVVRIVELKEVMPYVEAGDF